MCKTTPNENPPKTKNIGGPIPEELYWQFKQVQSSRKESATQALINAIRLYNEIDTMKGVNQDEQ